MNEGKEITLVTAFFDIGRGDLEDQKRSSNNYMEYFKFWARIQNRLIVFTTSDFAQQIREIRENFGRGKETIIVVEDNIWDIEADLYREMCRVEKSAHFKELRIRPGDISNRADYDYITLIKFWCLKKAVEEKYTLSGYTVWIDFGFNHGGDTFSDPEDFDYKWEYNFGDKICLFMRKSVETEVGLVKLVTMTDSIMAGIIVCPDEMCGLLYEMCTEAMWSLVSIDFMDDEQMLLRMAWRRHPEYFQLYESSWFMPLKEYGGGHLKLVQRVPEKKGNKKLFDVKSRFNCRKIRYLMRFYQAIKKESC